MCQKFGVWGIAARLTLLSPKCVCVHMCVVCMSMHTEKCMAVCVCVCVCAGVRLEMELERHARSGSGRELP